MLKFVKRQALIYVSGRTGTVLPFERYTWQGACMRGKGDCRGARLVVTVGLN
jgi:hypothetical protein